MDEPQPHLASTPLRRRPDGSSFLAASLALPGFLSSLIVLSLLGEAVLPQALRVVPLVWVLSGAALFARPVETAIAPLMYGARRPIEAEWRTLAFPWQAVCRAAGIDGSRYLLLVQDSNEVNAFAAGGRTVAVTRSSLQLHPAQLEAVLAHELGHHLSGHTTVSTLAWWYALPARAAAYLVALAVRFVLFIGRIFAAFGSGLGALASVLFALLLMGVFVYLSFWLILIPLTAPLLAWASRLGEFQADRTAASLGYGPSLIQVLSIWLLTDSDGARPTGLRERMLASHPSHADRINRLQADVR
jgi:STE24 endopeptidase